MALVYITLSGPKISATTQIRCKTKQSFKWHATSCLINQYN